MHFEISLAAVRQRNEHLPPLGFASPEDLLDMALIANGAAAMKNLVAVTAQQLLSGTLIEF